MTSQSNLELLFSKLSEMLDIDLAGGDIVPLPGSDGAMKDHLFVNLLRSIPVENDPQKMLAIFRDNAQQTLQLIESTVRPFLYASVVVTLYNVPEDGSNIRLYRTRIDGKDIACVRELHYTKFAQGEESHYPSIRSLLSRA